MLVAFSDSDVWLTPPSVTCERPVSCECGGVSYWYAGCFFRLWCVADAALAHLWASGLLWVWRRLLLICWLLFQTLMCGWRRPRSPVSVRSLVSVAASLIDMLVAFSDSDVWLMPPSLTCERPVSCECGGVSYWYAGCFFRLWCVADAALAHLWVSGLLWVWRCLLLICWLLFQTLMCGWRRPRSPVSVRSLVSVAASLIDMLVAFSDSDVWLMPPSLTCERPVSCECGGVSYWYAGCFFRLWCVADAALAHLWASGLLWVWRRLLLICWLLFQTLMCGWRCPRSPVSVRSLVSVAASLINMLVVFSDSDVWLTPPSLTCERPVSCECGGVSYWYAGCFFRLWCVADAALAHLWASGLLWVWRRLLLICWLLFQTLMCGWCRPRSPVSVRSLVSVAASLIDMLVAFSDSDVWLMPPSLTCERPVSCECGGVSYWYAGCFFRLWCVADAALAHLWASGLLWVWRRLLLICWLLFQTLMCGWRRPRSPVSVRSLVSVAASLIDMLVVFSDSDVWLTPPSLTCERPVSCECGGVSYWYAGCFFRLWCVADAALAHLWASGLLWVWRRLLLICWLLFQTLMCGWCRPRSPVSVRSLVSVAASLIDMLVAFSDSDVWLMPPSLTCERPVSCECGGVSYWYAGCFFRLWCVADAALAHLWASGLLWVWRRLLLICWLFFQTLMCGWRRPRSPVSVRSLVSVAASLIDMLVAFSDSDVWLTPPSLTCERPVSCECGGVSYWYAGCFFRLWCVADAALAHLWASGLLWVWRRLLLICWLLFQTLMCGWRRPRSPVSVRSLVSVAASLIDMLVAFSDSDVWLMPPSLTCERPVSCECGGVSYWYAGCFFRLWCVADAALAHLWASGLLWVWRRLLLICWLLFQTLMCGWCRPRSPVSVRSLVSVAASLINMLVAFSDSDVWLMPPSLTCERPVSCECGGVSYWYAGCFFRLWCVADAALAHLWASGLLWVWRRLLLICWLLFQTLMCGWRRPRSPVSVRSLVSVAASLIDMLVAFSDSDVWLMPPSLTCERPVSCECGGVSYWYAGCFFRLWCVADAALAHLWASGLLWVWRRLLLICWLLFQTLMCGWRRPRSPVSVRSLVRVAASLIDMLVAFSDSDVWLTPPSLTCERPVSCECGGVSYWYAGCFFRLWCVADAALAHLWASGLLWVWRRLLLICWLLFQTLMCGWRRPRSPVSVRSLVSVAASLIDMLVAFSDSDVWLMPPSLTCERPVSCECGGVSYWYAGCFFRLWCVADAALIHLWASGLLWVWRRLLLICWLLFQTLMCGWRRPRSPVSVRSLVSVAASLIDMLVAFSDSDVWLTPPSLTCERPVSCECGGVSYWYAGCFFRLWCVADAALAHLWASGLLWVWRRLLLICWLPFSDSDVWLTLPSLTCERPVSCECGGVFYWYAGCFFRLWCVADPALVHLWASGLSLLEHPLTASGLQQTGWESPEISKRNASY